MALTIAQKLDNLNQIVSSPVLNSLKIEIPAVRSHVKVDMLRQGVIETIEKQGHKYLINDNGMLQLVPVKKPAKKAKPSKAKAAAKKIAKEPVKAEQDTQELITSVIAEHKASGEAWYNTGSWIYSRKASFGTESKENRKNMYKMLDQTSGGVIPEKGINNDGEEIVLRKNNGAVKWAAWSETRLWTQYLARIFQAIELCGWSQVFPDGNLVDKETINELIKEAKGNGPGEAPVETFVRSAGLAHKKIEECSKEDVEAMENALVELNARFAEFKKGIK